MPASLRLTVLIWMIWTGFPLSGFAEKIILNSGEEFHSDKVWEEPDKVRFNMHGLIVSVKKDDVRAVLRNRADADPATEPETASMADPMNNATAPLEALAEAGTAPPADQKTAPSHPASSHMDPPAAPVTKSITGTGLLGLTWKASPASIPGLVKIKTEPSYGGIDQYHRPRDDLRMGDARLDGVVYGFWREQLYSIMMWVDGRPGYSQLKKTIRSHYGGGLKSNSGVERYVWKDYDTDRMLEFDEQLNTGIFWMRSRSLDRQIKRLYPE